MEGDVPTGEVSGGVSVLTVVEVVFSPRSGAVSNENRSGAHPERYVPRGPTMDPCSDDCSLVGVAVFGRSSSKGRGKGEERSFFGEDFFGDLAVMAIRSPSARASMNLDESSLDSDSMYSAGTSISWTPRDLRRRTSPESERERRGRGSMEAWTSMASGLGSRQVACRTAEFWVNKICVVFWYGPEPGTPEVLLSSLSDNPG
jgi:hypothetical protein